MYKCQHVSFYPIFTISCDRVIVCYERYFEELVRRGLTLSSVSLGNFEITYGSVSFTYNKGNKNKLA